MKIAEIEFFFNRHESKLEDLIDNLAYSLRMQGRIIDRPLSLLRKKQSYVIRCKIPECESLDTIKYSQRHEKFKEIEVKVVHSVLGEDIWSPSICSCLKSDYYILAGSMVIPLLCGTCGCAIPLYKIPFTYDADPSFYDIVCWNVESLAWSDIEFYNIGDIEEYACNQLSSIESKHSERALSICANISSRTGVTCYYYLENLKDSKSIEDEMKKKCPKCDTNWLLEKTLHERYDFKCDKCKIVSNFAYDVKLVR